VGRTTIKCRTFYVASKILHLLKYTFREQGRPERKAIGHCLLISAYIGSSPAFYAGWMT